MKSHIFLRYEVLLIITEVLTSFYIYAITKLSFVSAKVVSETCLC